MNKTWRPLQLTTIIIQSGLSLQHWFSHLQALPKELDFKNPWTCHRVPTTIAYFLVLTLLCTSCLTKQAWVEGSRRLELLVVTLSACSWCCYRRVYDTSSSVFTQSFLLSYNQGSVSEKQAKQTLSQIPSSRLTESISEQLFRISSIHSEYGGAFSVSADSHHEWSTDDRIHSDRQKDAEPLTSLSPTDNGLCGVWTH